MNQSNQVKSKKRVADHGEVFTSEREVSAMLDLVKQETERIDSRFLEPACGSGNFLIEILKRKLDIVSNKYKKNQHDYERYSVLVISSIYGVDILDDNAQECRARLFDLFNKYYVNLYKSKSDTELLDVVKFILNKNITCGDALTMKRTNGQPIIFSEWALVRGSQFKRRDYTLSQLLECRPFENHCLFSDTEEEVFIPKPTAEFPLVNISRIREYE